MKYKVVKSRNKKEENENPFDIQYFRTKFKVLNKRGHEKSTILSMKRSISHSKRSSAIEKDLQSIKNAESLKACPELLTHGGLRLEEINIHENHIKFHHKAHRIFLINFEPMQHFGGLFDDAEPEIDVEKELNAAFDDLEAKWGSIKDELFKNSVSNVKKHETTLRNEEILFNPLSADRLFSYNLYFISHPNQKIEDDIEGLSEIKKPRFFIDISEYINKMTASYDSFS
ncbi:hypothetical protein RF11_14886 [Thelohanellus kitauei]|uniref:Uncharacterized protein n=1 Tax=Thelohanellus kitauei TaxID=669202 RepID=A0A0C2MUN1_THEKT|nr:hypothetical protein RF11_14886 [Thelohanellus kitauei]